jgi:hypothetical protein
MASVFPYVEFVIFLVLAVADITTLQAFWPCLLQEPWPWPWLCSVSRCLILADVYILRKL